MCFRICPICGAHLDPDERCNCTEKAASGVATTEDGKQNKLNAILASNGGKINDRNQNQAAEP